MANAHWPLLEADNLCVTFPVSGGLWQPKRVVHAVNQVTMQIFPGETLGLVGESGSGKSTLGRAWERASPRCCACIKKCPAGRRRCG